MQLFAHVTPFEFPLASLIFVAGVLTGLALAWGWSRLRNPVSE